MKKYIILLWFLLSLLTSKAQDLNHLLTKMPFNSNVGILDSVGFNFTKNYTFSNSFWAIDSFPESVVFNANLSYISNSDSAQSYEIRVGKGGQLYSFKGYFGESVPPQWRPPNWVDSTYGGGTSYAPWVDEVWQMVCVDGSQNNSPDSNYFIHQAGVYLKTPLQKRPFYSPQVAEYYDSLNHSYTTVNWGQHAHTNNLSYTGFTSSLIYYTRYTVLGAGVLQIDNMIYNWGNDNIDFLNMPWGGVRNSNLDHFFIATPSNSYINSPGLYGQGPVVQTQSTGGWMAWSNDSLGTSATLAMAHPITTNTNGNVFRYGDAGNLDANWNDRDYHVFEMIRFPSNGQLGFGKSMSFRYFYVLGADIESVKSAIINNKLVSASLDTSYTASIYSVDSVRYSFLQQLNKITTSIDTNGSGLLLRTSPYANSYPLFKLTSSDSIDYISTDPYYLSESPWDGLMQSISLLGFLNNQSSLVVINDTICSGSSYVFADGTIRANIGSSMSFVSHLNSSLNGWDSIMYYNIIVDHNTSSYDTLSAIESVLWNGITIDNSGDYYAVLTNLAGCDSMTHLNLTITTTAISDMVKDGKSLIKKINLLGKESIYIRNTPLFYIYNDGSVEKKIIIE